jgi:hypothetical protein
MKRAEIDGSGTTMGEMRNAYKISIRNSEGE